MNVSVAPNPAAKTLLKDAAQDMYKRAQILHMLPLNILKCKLTQITIFHLYLGNVLEKRVMSRIARSCENCKNCEK